MDRTNFIDFIKDNDNKEAEPHGWKRLLQEEEREASNPIILSSHSRLTGSGQGSQVLAMELIFTSLVRNIAITKCEVFPIHRDYWRNSFRNLLSLERYH